MSADIGRTRAALCPCPVIAIREAARPHTTGISLPRCRSNSIWPPQGAGEFGKTASVTTGATARIPATVPRARSDIGPRDNSAPLKRRSELLAMERAGFRGYGFVR